MLYEAFWSPHLYETFLSSCISVSFRHSYLTSVSTDRIIQLLLFSWRITLWLYFFIFFGQYRDFSEVKKPKQRRKNDCHILRGENPWQRQGAAELQSRRLSPQWDEWSSTCKGWAVPGASQLPLLHPKSWQRTPTPQLLCVVCLLDLYFLFLTFFLWTSFLCLVWIRSSIRFVSGRPESHAERFEAWDF